MNAQNVIPDDLLFRLEVASSNNTSDNIYIQTSKDIYETSEDLWFKAYVLNSQTNTPSIKSKTLYLQMVQESNDYVVLEEKYEIKNGFVDGHLYLSDSLQEGNYTLTAYTTQSFFKDDEDFYSVRKFKVIKNIKNIKPSIIEKDSTILFTMFPEGGTLISGIQSKLAFKSVNSKGMPIEVSGTLYENNVLMLELNTTHAGMGSLIFTPNSNRKYYIQLNNDPNRTYPLPEIQNNGMVLQLSNVTKDQATFIVAQPKELKEQKIYLRLQIKGVVYKIATGTLINLLKINLPLDDVPQGIAEVTLFNEDLIPMAERLVYIKQDQQLRIKTILDKSEYKTRERATLKIKVTDENEKSVVAHLGLSVYDEIYQNKLDTKNILTHYQLSTQLKGSIYNPSYYFDKDNNNRKEALDLLLLTQGWRRYVWNEENLKRRNLKLQPLISDTLVGSIYLKTKTKSADILAGKVVMAFTADTLKGQDFLMTDTSGKFTVFPEHFKMAEKSYLYLKPMTPETPKYTISIKDASFDLINSNRKSKTINYPLPKQLEVSINNSEDSFIVGDEVNKLDEVVLNSKRNKIFRDKYLSSLDSLAKFLSPDYVGSCGQLNCPLHLSKTKPVEGVEYARWISTRKAHGHDGWFLYEEYERKKYQYKIYTEEELLNKFNLRMIKGYYGEREFYQPLYNKDNLEDPFPDYRNTLLWKPDIITDENGEATIEFYCSDINTKFLGHIEGVGNGRLLGVENFEFMVRKKD